MTELAVLAVVLAVVIVGVIVVVARELLRNVRKLQAGVAGVRERFAPLVGELQAELAVTSLELAGLGDGVERARREQERRRRRRLRRR